MEISEYCRQIESYLCAKNDGHLIRIVGPSFEIVSGWAKQGVPLKVACRGIDRYFERYYAKGPRRRPVKIDFCDADVRDVFDEWRRALGLTQSSVDSHQSSDESRQSPVEVRAKSGSLPAHLERVLLRLTNARARGTVGAGFDELLDRVARELDEARAGVKSLRGEARKAVIARLEALDAALGERARAGLDEGLRRNLEQEAADELSSYRAAMTPEAYDRALAAAADRLTRERLGLPTIRF